jgi:hypothetical protein
MEVRYDIATLNKLLSYKLLVVTRLYKHVAFTKCVYNPEDRIVG